METECSIITEHGPRDINYDFGFCNPPEDTHVGEGVEDIGGIEEYDKHTEGLINNLENNLSLDNDDIMFLHISKK